MALKEREDWESQDKINLIKHIIFELDLERKREILWVRGSGYKNFHKEYCGHEYTSFLFIF